MKAYDAIEFLEHTVSTKQPVMLWGPPGVGKSEIVKQLADKLFMKQAKGKPYFIDLRLPLLDAVDLRGIPTLKNGKTEWIPPSFLPTDSKGILFLDELMQAMPIVQSAASQLILDRRIGEYVLPDGWIVIAAGNRETDRASTNKMPTHIANRFIHINIEVSVDHWVDWAFSNNINPCVIAFIRMRPELLHNFDMTQKAFPTPRSWSFVSKILPGLKKEFQYEAIAGTVGEGAANEFTGFMRVYHELPEYEDIASRPAKVNISDNAAVLYAIATMISYNAKPKDSRNLFIFINRLPKEFQMLTVLDMGRNNIDMCETRDYIKWKSDNQDILLGKK